ncbi:tetratricopeptide repeat protein [bacterium]|nr:tetratricopeptide repeat protein [bacterium]
MKPVILSLLLLLACLILSPRLAAADPLNDEQVAIAAERNGDRDTALTLYQSALAGYGSAGQHTEAARVAQSLMLLQISMGDIADAMASSEQARSMLVEAGRSDAAAQLAGMLASLLKARSEYGLAEDSYLAALAIHRGSGNRVSEAGTLMSLGVLAELMEKPQRSAEYYEEAGEVYLDLGDERGLMHSYTNAGQARLEADDPRAAEQAFRQALFLCGKLDDPHSCVAQQLGLSQALRLMQRHAEALEAIAACLELLQERPDDLLRARTLLEQGRVLAGGEDPQQALQVLEEAWQLFGREARQEEQAAMATELIEAAQAAGRSDLAARYRQLRSELNVSS